jgi:hypothetical protein
MSVAGWRPVVGVSGRIGCGRRNLMGEPGASRPLSRVVAMLDFLMVAYGVGFFAAAILYVLACEKM